MFVKVGGSESESALFVNSLCIQEAGALLGESDLFLCVSDSVLASRLVLWC